MRRKRGTKMNNVTEMVVGRPNDVINMGGVGEGPIEDDTQTLT